MILRWGQAAESLAWAVPFFIQPVVAAFYPVSVLPGWLQPVALALPVTHVFEGMLRRLDEVWLVVVEIRHVEDFGGLRRIVSRARSPSSGRMLCPPWLS